EPVEERAAGEQDDQEDREQEARDRIAEHDHRRGPGVETRAVLHRLADAERYRDQIGQKRQPEAERDRDRQLLLDELDDADGAEIALAEIEARVIPDHQQQACGRRLVEAELLLQLLDEIRVEPLRAAIFRIDGVAAGADLSRRALREITAARNARAAAGVGARELRNDAFDRATWRE